MDKSTTIGRLFEEELSSHKKNKKMEDEVAKVLRYIEKIIDTNLLGDAPSVAISSIPKTKVEPSETNNLTRNSKTFLDFHFHSECK